MYRIYIRKKNEIQINNLNIKCKYNDAIMKETSIKAWSFLKEILFNEYNISLDNERLYYNEHGKPYLSNRDLYFNISHSNNLIAIIISDIECGIDIEYLDENREINKIVKKIMNDEELLLFNNSNKKIYYFYEIWTKKEAYFKMIGTGIELKKLNDSINIKNIQSKIINNDNEKYYLSFAIKK